MSPWLYAAETMWPIGALVVVCVMIPYACIYVQDRRELRCRAGQKKPGVVSAGQKSAD